MEEIHYVITDPEGVHALPAGGLVKLAKSFECSILASGNGQSTDCKKIFGLMSLGIKSGQTLTIVCDGSDEALAITALRNYLTDNL